MKAPRVAVALGIAGALLLAACSASLRPAPASTASIGALDRAGALTFPSGDRSVVPVVSGRTLQGTAISTAQFANHVYVLNVWASWCGPCKAESPALASLARGLMPSGVKFIGMDEADTKAAAARFAASVRVPYPELFDAEGDALAHLKLLPVKGIPSTLVVDRAGRMAARVIGAVSADELRRLITFANTP
jgi:thiol-disulfide isomerase/thioredoxin